MKGYIIDIEDAALKTGNYRQVLFTAKHCQLVLMSLRPGEKIGEEVHDLDQFIRFEAGEGNIVMDGQTHAVADGFAGYSGRNQTQCNSSKTEALKLYSLYSLPEHKVGTVHKTKQEADGDEHHHFDGRTAELAELDKTQELDQTDYDELEREPRDHFRKNQGRAFWIARWNRPDKSSGSFSTAHASPSHPAVMRTDLVMNSRQRLLLADY